ncbi:flavin reductase family protein [uncultured Victivallis sp.]|uniref:flavin reductase family protein n=1 Tax=uncultured Victivallis sp. TaxID=354118 RepID=UPI0025E3A7AB|nr:flavin reductase family protein [uncultured Victivallis sp.]
MRKNFGVQTWLYPMPVLIVGTYDEAGTPDAMNAAWGGIHDTNQIGVCIDPGHQTAKNLLAKRVFTVSVGDAAHVVECDFVGLVSGKNEPDKLGKAGFHSHRAELVDAPVIDELPMTLECRLVSYDPETGCTVGEIVNVSADERILDSDGKIDPSKFEPITFDPVNHRYRKLGEVVGTAFRDGRKLL